MINNGFKIADSTVTIDVHSYLVGMSSKFKSLCFLKSVPEEQSNGNAEAL